MSRLCFHWSFTNDPSTLFLKKVYKVTSETDSAVQVRHWYGKRWHPKNNYWKVAEADV